MTPASTSIQTTLISMETLGLFVTNCLVNGTQSVDAGLKMIRKSC